MSHLHFRQKKIISLKPHINLIFFCLIVLSLWRRSYTKASVSSNCIYSLKRKNIPMTFFGLVTPFDFSSIILLSTDRSYFLSIFFTFFYYFVIFSWSCSWWESVWPRGYKPSLFFYRDHAVIYQLSTDLKNKNLKKDILCR